MQSILGALLTAGYTAAAVAAVASAPSSDKINASVEGELENSFSSAADTAERYPDHANQIIAAAKESFLQGDEWAYIAGIAAIALGAVLVYFAFPGKEDEERLLASYEAEDAA
jgi:hypothetical protein